jgi:outer membrane receptor for ferrienterochelin and colicin
MPHQTRSPAKTGFLKSLIFPSVLPFLSASLNAQAEKSLLDYPLEDLMEVMVVSASKRLERTLDAPMSVSVLKQKDIIRSRALNIPEALRYSPAL